MAKKTGILWTDHTFNPWWGCTKVSAGCKNCYAEAHDHRSGGQHWGAGVSRRRTSQKNWNDPVRWNWQADPNNPAAVLCCAVCGHRHVDAACPECGSAERRRPRVFCASMADWLDPEVPADWLADLLLLIHRTPHLDWQLLTKRPENWYQRVRSAVQELIARNEKEFSAEVSFLNRWLAGGLLPNVWVGVTAESQLIASTRVPLLMRIPTKVGFLSCEPLLGPIKIPPEFMMFRGFQPWVIVGGESGPGARPMDIDWVRQIVQQCGEHQVPVFVKQMGAKPYDGDGFAAYQPEVRLHLQDRHHGGDMSEWAKDLQIRQFPPQPATTQEIT